MVELLGEPAPARIGVGRLAIRAAGQGGAQARGHGTELRRLSVEVRPGQADQTPSAIRAFDAERLRLIGNRIAMAGRLSHHAAVYLDVLEDAVVERNRIEVETLREEGRADAWGGLQLAGGSRRVEIRENQFLGGRGHGITLGSVRFRAADGSELGLAGAGFGQSAAEAPFALGGRLGPVDAPGPDDTSVRYYPEPEPAIEDLLIADNAIEGCRGSGVGALAIEVQHDEVASAAPLCMRRTTFRVDRLELRNNCIERNARRAPGELGASRTRGGIVLSEARRLDIVGNRIESNGVEPEPGPVCGVFLAFGQDVVIAENRIADNGRPSEGDRGVVGLRGGGLRGGIVLRRAAELALTTLSHEASIQRVSLRRNVVESPSGSALLLVAGGACSVTANHFETRDRSSRGATGALTVTILHPGRPWEAVDLPINEPSPVLAPARRLPGLPGRTRPAARRRRRPDLQRQSRHNPSDGRSRPRPARADRLHR